MNKLYVSDDYFAMRNLTNPENFKILKTWKYNLRPHVTSGDQPRRFFDLYYKFKKPLKVKYSGTGNSVSDADRNALFLVVMSNGAASLSPTVSEQTRLTFKDI